MKENFIQGLYLAKDQAELMIVGLALIALGLFLVVFEVARSARND